MLRRTRSRPKARRRAVRPAARQPAEAAREEERPEPVPDRRSSVRSRDPDRQDHRLEGPCPPRATEQNGLGATAKDVAEHASSLFRLELELATLELKKKATNLGLGVGPRARRRDLRPLRPRLPVRDDRRRPGDRDVDLARDPDRHARALRRSQPILGLVGRQPDQEGHAARSRAGDPRGQADPERTEVRWRLTRTTARPSRYAARSRPSAISWPASVDHLRAEIGEATDIGAKVRSKLPVVDGRSARRRVLPRGRSRRDDEVARAPRARGRESDEGPRRAVLLRRPPLTRPLASSPRRP